MLDNICVCSDFLRKTGKPNFWEEIIVEITDYEIYVKDYLNNLRDEEHSPATIRQYRHDILWFFSFLGSEELTREATLSYKEKLEQKYQPVSVNAKLSALNSFFSFVKVSTLWLNGIFCWNYMNQMLWAGFCTKPTSHTFFLINLRNSSFTD